MKSFQTDSGLSADGVAGAGTRKVLFGAYMDWLCTSPGSTTPFKMQITDFLGGASAAAGDTPKLSTQSCGKFNPILLLANSVMQGSDREGRNALDAPNRRVMMFLFKAGTVVDPATWPCPLIGATGDACKSAFWPDGDQRRTNGDVERSYKLKPDTMACRFYDRFARRSPCERGAFKIWLQDPQRQRMPNAPYRFTCGTIVRTGNADSNGLVTMFLNTAETTATLQWGQLPTSSDASTSSSSSQTSQNDQTAYVYARQIIINPERSERRRPRLLQPLLPGEHGQRERAGVQQRLPQQHGRRRARQRPAQDRQLGASLGSCRASRRFSRRR